jgi:hypothetical protein
MRHAKQFAATFGPNAKNKLARELAVSNLRQGEDGIAQHAFAACATILQPSADCTQMQPGGDTGIRCKQGSA